MTAIPTLTTDRLILRAFRESDCPAIAALHGDPEVARFIRSQPEPELAKAWDYIAVQLGHWVMKGQGKWAAIERSSGRLIGRIGYFDAPYDWPGLELGWTLSRECWGNGYATEGARAALDWGFKTLNAAEIISAIHPDNTPSIRVAERLGERHRRNGTVHGKPCLIYGITIDDWRAQTHS